MSSSPRPTPVLELRVALTTGAYERLVEFYCVGLGLEPSQLWTSGLSSAARPPGQKPA